MILEQVMSPKQLVVVKESAILSFKKVLPNSTEQLVREKVLLRLRKTVSWVEPACGVVCKNNQNVDVRYPGLADGSDLIDCVNSVLFPELADHAVNCRVVKS